MKYRVFSTGVSNAEVVVQDISQPSERLYGTIGCKFGKNVQVKMSYRDFIKKVYKSILSLNTITRMKMDDLNLEIDWVEETEDELIEHNDVMELRGMCGTRMFRDLRRCEMLYSLLQRSTRNRLRKKAANKPFVADEPFVYKETSFADFVEADLKILEDIQEEASSSKTNNFLETYRIIENLVIGYSIDCEKGISVDKANYLVRLSEMEADMYSLSSDLGILPTAPKLGIENLKERLKYLGWSQEQIESDEYISQIMKGIESISKVPYAACEVQIAKLIGLAFSYVSLMNITDGPKAREFHKDFLYGEFENILREASRKLRAALSLESLTDSIYREMQESQEKVSISQDEVPLNHKQNL